MKTQFSVNALVASILTVRGYNVAGQDGINQAAESYLNGMTAGKTESDRTSLRERKNGLAVTSETTRIEYSAKRNDVSAFIAWNDAIASLNKKAAKLQAVITVSDIPANIASWLDSKPTFKAPPAAEQQQQSGSNRRNRRNQEVTTQQQ